MPRITLTLFLVLLLSLFASQTHAQTDYSVFISPSEFLIHPGDTFTTQVHISPLPPAGLYSMGVKITFDGAKTQVIHFDDIIIPDAINSGPFGGPPDKSTSFGYAAAAGVVVQFQGYLDSLLVSFNLTDLTEPAYPFNSYTLNLDLYYDPPATNFFDFDQQQLDELITFTSAAVTVTVPGDFDGDQNVNLKDFAHLAAQWLQNDCGACNACDLNGDHAVGLLDLNIFLQNWLKKPVT
ncbi:MAG: hypothetical protein GY869_05940 [Planctomycetes bacterium]|nr:hypothetical protein [Planctomycetota bacterium]